eukprot:14258-Heterococcus_DN1.PRE.6
MHLIIAILFEALKLIASKVSANSGFHAGQFVGEQPGALKATISYLQLARYIVRIYSVVAKAQHLELLPWCYYKPLKPSQGCQI